MRMRSAVTVGPRGERLVIRRETPIAFDAAREILGQRSATEEHAADVAPAVGISHLESEDREERPDPVARQEVARADAGTKLAVGIPVRDLKPPHRERVLMVG